MKKTVVLSLIILTMACGEKPEQKEMYTLFVGTYTNGASEGIYSLQFNPETGNLDSLKLAAELPNPSFVTISKDKQHLYAVQENSDFDSRGGGVSAFKLKDGGLELQNSMGTGGPGPCHVSLSEDGRLAVSNYVGGNVALFKLKDDGSFGDAPQIIDHKVLDTTKTPHAHMAQFTKEGLFVADLGLDAVKRYQLEDGEFVPGDQPSLSFANGAGPRHFTFGQNGKLYVINELNATISVFEKDADGAYQEIQVVETLDPTYEGRNACADIHLSADGKFLYGSNRGENTIVIFAVDGSSGKLDLVGRQSVHGNWPRNFALDPTENFLLVANKISSNIVVFKRDVEAGTLTYLSEIEVPNPICLEFLD
ncbi:lactonase family protein [Muricauda sp. CAU 1633]|uniref:lactonase family protein n=1 Tax=Allomuricauda sp. CAU 1633 TaxID=2816036 RepID=UPI001A8C3A10|nr:lactonase family protein [Muricauda sp. CAU 1633]MBO0320849.1 lactonase family protein [Muricauda sp. CAU 1633]